MSRARSREMRTKPESDAPIRVAGGRPDLEATIRDIMALDLNPGASLLMILLEISPGKRILLHDAAFQYGLSVDDARELEVRGVAQITRTPAAVQLKEGA